MSSSCMLHRMMSRNQICHIVSEKTDDTGGIIGYHRLLVGRSRHCGERFIKMKR